MILRSNHARYLIIAAACALLNNVIFIVGDGLQFGYTLLVMLTFLITGSLGYVLHSWFTFRCERGWTRYGRFMAGIAMGIPITLAAVAILRSVVGLPMPVAAPMVTGTMIIYNFISARIAIMLVPLERFRPECAKNG